MRNRIDKLGVAEPEIRKQGSNQIVIQLAGVHDPKKAAELIGKTAQLELFDLEADLTGPSISSQGIPYRRGESLRPARGQQAQAEDGTPTGFYVFDDEEAAGRRAGPDARGGDPGARQRDQRREGAARRRARPGSSARPTRPSYKIFAVPAGVIVITCGTSAVVCPGVNESPPTRTYYYLMKYQPADQANPIPEMNGRRPEALRYAAGLRPPDRPAGGAAGLHRQGPEALPRDHEERGGARADGRTRASARAGPTRTTSTSTSRSCSTATSSPSRRSTSTSSRAGSTRSSGARITGIRSTAGGEGPRARAPDRCAAGRVQADRAHRRLGDARQGLAEAGEDGGADRPARRRALPAHLLPLPRRDRRRRPRDLRRRSCTRRSCS